MVTSTILPMAFLSFSFIIFFTCDTHNGKFLNGTNHGDWGLHCSHENLLLSTAIFQVLFTNLSKKGILSKQINPVPLVVSQKFGLEAVAGPAMGQWKHEIYVGAFGRHLFYDKFYRGKGPLDSPSRNCYWGRGFVQN